MTRPSKKGGREMLREKPGQMRARLPGFSSRSGWASIKQQKALSHWFKGAREAKISGSRRLQRQVDRAKLSQNDRILNTLLVGRRYISFRGRPGEAETATASRCQKSLRVASAVKSRTEFSANFGTDLPSPMECSGHVLACDDLVFCFSANFLFR